MPLCCGNIYGNGIVAVLCIFGSALDQNLCNWTCMSELSSKGLVL